MRVAKHATCIEVVNKSNAMEVFGQPKKNHVKFLYLAQPTCRWNHSWSADELPSRVLKDAPHGDIHTITVQDVSTWNECVRSIFMTNKEPDCETTTTSYCSMLIRSCRACEFLLRHKFRLRKTLAFGFGCGYWFVEVGWKILQCTNNDLHGMIGRVIPFCCSPSVVRSKKVDRYWSPQHIQHSCPILPWIDFRKSSSSCCNLTSPEWSTCSRDSPKNSQNRLLSARSLLNPFQHCTLCSGCIHSKPISCAIQPSGVEAWDVIFESGYVLVSSHEFNN